MNVLWAKGMSRSLLGYWDGRGIEIVIVLSSTIPSMYHTTQLHSNRTGSALN